MSLGGHDIPVDTIRRRYLRSLDNIFKLYHPMADSWEFYDNSNGQQPRLLADGIDHVDEVRDNYLWAFIRKQVIHEQ